MSAVLLRRSDMDNKQTGVEELRIVLNQLNVEGNLHAFSAEEIIRICRAVRASGWDVYPGQLPTSFLRHAARTGKLSKRALAYIEYYYS
jgi:hypothetical protein